jgi:hypothetical protein
MTALHAHSAPAPTVSATRSHESPVKRLTAPASAAISISVAPVNPNAGASHPPSRLPSAPPAGNPSDAVRLCSRIASSVALATSVIAKPTSETASERRLKLSHASTRR